MRVNVYAEEMTQRVELVRKGEFTGVRFYLELPVALSTPAATLGGQPGVAHISGPFVHKPGDDESAAVTFWGKRKLKGMLIRALQLLDQDERPASANELRQASDSLNASIAGQAATAAGTMVAASLDVDLKSLTQQMRGHTFSREQAKHLHERLRDLHRHVEIATEPSR